MTAFYVSPTSHSTRHPHTDQTLHASRGQPSHSTLHAGAAAAAAFASSFGYPNSQYRPRDARAARKTTPPPSGRVRTSRIQIAPLESVGVRPTTTSSTSTGVSCRVNRQGTNGALPMHNWCIFSANPVNERALPGRSLSAVRSSGVPVFSLSRSKTKGSKTRNHSRTEDIRRISVFGLGSVFGPRPSDLLPRSCNTPKYFHKYVLVGTRLIACG
jgi:hypothetical protein